jgi:hypothetical protein
MLKYLTGNGIQIHLINFLFVITIFTLPKFY